VSGVLFGTRVTEWQESMKFFDERMGLSCEIKFSEGAGLLIGRGSKPTDYFEYRS